MDALTSLKLPSRGTSTAWLGPRGEVTRSGLSSRVILLTARWSISPTWRNRVIASGGAPGRDWLAGGGVGRRRRQVALAGGRAPGRPEKGRVRAGADRVRGVELALHRPVGGGRDVDPQVTRQRDDRGFMRGRPDR